MAKLFMFFLGLVGGVISAIMQAIPTFWPSKQGQKPKAIWGIIWVISMCFWAIFGGVSIFDFHQLENTNEILTAVNKKYEQQIGFDKIFISLLPGACIDFAGKKYSEAQSRLKVVENIREKVGSPDYLLFNLGLHGVSK